MSPSWRHQAGLAVTGFYRGWPRRSSGEGVARSGGAEYFRHPAAEVPSTIRDDDGRILNRFATKCRCRRHTRQLALIEGQLNVESTSAP